MGTVYFTRHGQTVWNVENKICGATDSPLTDLGHEQAIELGKKILEEGIQIDEILYSPLIRAKATALHVSEITGIPAREEIRLKEQNFGKYESTPRDGEEFAKAKCNFICRFNGGETMLHLAQRIYNLLDEEARRFYTERVANKPEGYANARDLRNYLEKAISNQASRIVGLKDVDKNILAMLEKEDLVGIEL